MKTILRAFIVLAFAQPLWAQVPTRENTFSGLPPCPNGTPSQNWTNCDGKVRYQGGATYEGAYIDGKHNGKGKYVSADGVTYEGDHRDNKRHGHFTITYSDGEKREVTYVNGKLTAVADMKPPRDQFVGERGLKDRDRVTSPDPRAPAAGEVLPNLSISTGSPKRPGRPSGAYYEMMSIEGKSDTLGRVYIQIFSDGQASVISNNKAQFFMHTGNGIFVNGEERVIVDERNRSVRVHQTTVSNVTILKKQREKPLEQTAYGEKFNFPGLLQKAQNETDLKAACASAASGFGRKTDWANKAALRDATFWSTCVDMSEVNNPDYRASRSKWDGLLKTTEAFTLAIYFDRCTRDYILSILPFENRTTGLIERRCGGVSVNH